MADLTRDDLARLVALVAKHDEWAAKGVATAGTDAWNETWGERQAAVRELAYRMADHADALLALATEALDRRDGPLVFGPEFHECRYANAADGAPYMLTRLPSGRFGISTLGWQVECATESEAIDAARAHDKARRGGK